MDADTARDRAINWGTILCLDVPGGATFGVDQHAWAIGPKFRGVKMIPPGPHFISYGASDTFGASATTISFFTFVKPQQVTVRKWDAKIEDLVEIEDEEERERFVLGVRRWDFDAGLGAYPFEKYQDWQSLSSFITENVILHLEPPAKRVSSAASSESLEEEKKILEQLNNFHLQNSEAKQKTSQDFNDDEPPPLESPADIASSSTSSPSPSSTSQSTKKIDLSDYCPKFTRIPKRAADKGATPQQITEQNMDKSTLLRKILETSYSQDNTMLLGELQYAFITFFFGHSFEGFRQWKELLILITNCERAMRELAGWFCSFVDVVNGQVELIPRDFFHDTLSGNNFIKQIFKGFFESLLEPGMDLQLTNKGKQLKTKMEKRFEISFSVEEFEDEEDAPVLVVLDE